jgi:hypothetical protein
MSTYRSSLFVFLGTLLLCLGAFAQEDPPDIAGLIKQLDAEHKSKDPDARKIMSHYKELQAAYTPADPADRKKIAKAVGKAFGITPSNQTLEFQRHAAQVLSTLEKEGLDALLSAAKSSKLKPKKKADEAAVKASIDVRVAVIEAIGSYKDFSATYKTLKKLSWSEENEVVFTACRALAEFHDLPVKQKRHIVEDMIDRYDRITSQETVKSKKKSDATDALFEMADKLLVFQPIDEALRKLTGQESGVTKDPETGKTTKMSMKNAASWKQWYKDHKNDRTW